MKKLIVPALILGGALLLLLPHDVMGRGRGGGGGGGGRGGGIGGGGGGGRSYGGGGVVQSYGGGGGGRIAPSAPARPSQPIVGSGGGNRQTVGGSGSITTKGGSTIDYGGAAKGGSGPLGGQSGKYVGGIQVTTPGGKEVTKVGSGGAAQGPGGNAVGGKSSTTVGTGPQGGFATKSQGGAAIGPQGGVAGKSQVGAAAGPGGAAVGGSRAGVASGPYGAAAGKVGAVSGNRGTAYRSAAAIRGQGGYVRAGVANYPCFRPGWYAQHPGAWFAAGWVANTVWRATTWGDCATYCGTAEEPVYYNYGENVVYQDDGVYFDGEKAYSTEEYAQDAVDLANSGRDAKATKEEEWLPLGVFAMVRGEETVSNHIYQLAVNKNGVIRGNYYDAVTDTTSPLYGSMDPKTQRAAWTVGDSKTPVYEVGFANLTKNETTMMVHYGKERSQQFTLIRIEEPQAGKEGKGEKATGEKVGGE